MAKNIVVVGTQWGDEGKGKIVNWLTDQAQGVVRFQGGHNAGHTLLIFMVILPVTAIISMLPSCGGLGVREASVIYFLKIYSSTASATAFILAYDILIYGFGLFCGIVYLFFGGRVKVKEIISND